MQQHPDGGERAHPNIEPGFARNDADAAERPHELFLVFETTRIVRKS